MKTMDGFCRTAQSWQIWVCQSRVNMVLPLAFANNTTPTHTPVATHFKRETPQMWLLYMSHRSKMEMRISGARLKLQGGCFPIIKTSLFTQLGVHARAYMGVLG